MTVIEPTTHTLAVPGATLAYDVRRSDHADHPPLLLIGYPMAAGGFTTLAGHFPDRAVVTYDPRGIERSTKQDPAAPMSVEEHVEDLHRLAREVGQGPVDVFASSGGAVVGLGLVATHPDDVRTLVAHEPPMLDVLPDREAATAAWLAVHASYERSGFGAGMAHFIALTSHAGPFPADWADQPAPDPAMFGMPAEDDGSRDDPLLSQGEEGVPFQRLDATAIQAAPTRVVLAAGVESEGQLTQRATAEVAARLGTEPVAFPGDHGGFLGGEYGQTGEPEAFAARLRDVLDER